MKPHKFNGNLSYLNEAVEAKEISKELKRFMKSKNWVKQMGGAISV
jgi:hypothetical protein